jgi:DNA invertase Pin-like site-specific DNA recombinase
MSEHKREQTKAIAYVRVAAPVQKEEELNIQKQKQQIAEAVKQMNVEVVKWFIQEGYEPLSFRNSVLNQAVEYCQDNPTIKYLLVANISRLSRSLDHCIYWQVAFESGVGVTILSADEIEFESPIARFQKNLSQMVGQLDNENRSRMIKRAIQRKKALEA